MSHCKDGHNCSCSGSGAAQSLDELEFERGIWGAALEGDLNRIEKLLTRPDANINQRDNYDYTALHYAARNGNLKVCAYLVKNGANVNATTRSGLSTPLHRASYAGHSEIVKLLLENKADPTLVDTDGKSALDKAIENKKEDVIYIIKQYL